MALRFGRQDQVKFSNLHEYYYALGFLANKNNAEIRWENNEEQGAWGSEGRIHCLVSENNFPPFFKFTAGRGNVYARINCNDYVSDLVSKHNFKNKGIGQRVEDILSTVPDNYQDDFISGYGKPISKIKYEPRKGESSIIKESKQAEQPQPKVDDYQPPKIIVGSKVKHKSFGVGTVNSVDSTNLYCSVIFDVGEKKFVIKSAFKDKYLELI